jgi:hypothetical protein
LNPINSLTCSQQVVWWACSTRGELTHLEQFYSSGTFWKKDLNKNYHQNNWTQNRSSSGHLVSGWFWQLNIALLMQPRWLMFSALNCFKKTVEEIWEMKIPAIHLPAKRLTITCNRRMTRNEILGHARLHFHLGYM